MFKPCDISTDLCRQTFADALRAEVGAGKAYTVERASDHLGIDARTLRSYLAGENLPPFCNLVRMFSLFGPVFVNTVLRLAHMDGATVIEAHAVSDLELNGDTARVLGDLGQALRKGVMSPSDRQKVKKELRRLINQEENWLAQHDPLPAAAPVMRRAPTKKGRG